MQKYKVYTYKYDGEELRVGGTYNAMKIRQINKTIKNLVIERYGKFDVSKLEFVGERDFEVTPSMVRNAREA